MLSPEGEEALNLYIKRYEGLLRKLAPSEQDPLKDICGIGRSKERAKRVEGFRTIGA